VELQGPSSQQFLIQDVCWKFYQEFCAFKVAFDAKEQTSSHEHIYALPTEYDLRHHQGLKPW
jgi:hypothetical protein